MPKKIVYTPNYTVVGSPTISDEYVASNFSGSNYLTLPVTIDSTDDTWEVYLNFTSTSYDYQHIFGVANDNNAILISAESGVIRMYLSSGSSWGIAGAVGDFAYSLNVHYYVKLQFTGTNYILSVSTDEENWTVSANVSSSTKIASGKTLYFGSCWDRNTNYLRGSSDLKKFYIKKNGVKAWEAVTVTEVETSGTVSVSKGYYDNGSNKIQITSAITKYLDDISSGETIACKNKLFAYSKNGTADIRITTNNDITTSHDVSVELNKNVYLSCLKNYIIGHTPLQKIPMAIGGELTTDYTANDPSSVDSDYILHSTAQGKYVYKNFSESDITTGEITLKCKQTAIKYRSDVISGWALIGFAEGYLGMWDGGNWRTNTYYSAGTWVWVKAVYTPATYNFKIYGLVDNGYTLETLPDLSQWTLEYNGQPTGTHFMTQALYLPDAGSEWFQGDIDLKTVQVKKNGVEIWRAVTMPATAVRNSSNGFVYDSTNDKTFWYPTETILELRNFTDLQDRCNLYLANEDGKDASRFLAGSSLPGPVKTNYVVEGSPTINSSYEASNFTNSNYISIPETIPSTDGTSIITAIKVSGSPPADTGCFLGNSLGTPNVYLHDTKILGCYDGDYSQAGSTVLADNTKYWLQIRYYSSSTQFYLLQDNGYTLDTLPAVSNWTLQFSFSNKNEFGGKDIILGKISGGLPFTVGTIYLADTAIAANGVYVWKAVEQNPVISSSMQQGYVYLNSAHDKVLGVGDSPDEIELETKVTPIENYTVVGSPAISSDYIASSFASNGILSNEYIENTFNTFEIGTVITTGGSVSSNQIFFCCEEDPCCPIAINTYSSRFSIFLASSTSSLDIASQLNGAHTISANTKYWVKLVYDGTQYILSYSTDGVNYTDTITVSNSTKVASFTPTLGNWVKNGTTPDASGFSGSIDLKNTYIKVDGVEVWRAVSTGIQDTVAASDDHYWTWLANASIDYENFSVSASNITGYGSTGHVYFGTYNNLPILTTDTSNSQQASKLYSGYDITFTSNARTAIQSLTLKGERCRVYSGSYMDEGTMQLVTVYAYIPYRYWADVQIPTTDPYKIIAMGYSDGSLVAVEVDNLVNYRYYTDTDKIVFAAGSSIETELSYAADYLVNYKLP